MALLRPRKYKVWLHPREVIYILGQVERRGDETPDELRALEHRALDKLGKKWEKWGLKRVTESDEPKAKTYFTEESVLAFMDSRGAPGLEDQPRLRLLEGGQTARGK